MEEVSPEKGIFNVYPNPVMDKLNIVGLGEYDYLQIVDQYGRIVGKSSGNQKAIELSVESLVEGLYILVVVKDGEMQCVKFEKR
ncbi:MAG TPA: T9SS type A sorting domain-containing protein [Cytophagaceae bacterium]